MLVYKKNMKISKDMARHGVEFTIKAGFGPGAKVKPIVI